MRFIPLAGLVLLTLSLGVGCTSSKESTFVSKEKSTIVTKELTYSAGGKTMKGFVAIPDGEGPFPGILVVHEWWGQTEYPRNRARQLAKNGYVAMALDMYGDGQTADHPEDAKKFSSQVMKDMGLAEKSFSAALAVLKKQDKVDPEKIGAMGYCFGGAVVLEMARRGLDLDVVASYHGNLTPIVKNKVKTTNTRILIFNGAADSFVPEQAVQTTRKKLKEAKIRYKFVNFQGAKHGFTNPEATAKGEKYKLPLAYDARADQTSWDETMKAFQVVFK